MTDRTMNTPMIQALAGLLQPEGLARLREQHQPDARGRCISCRPGGDSTGAVPWPCTTENMLRAAAQFDNQGLSR